MVFFPCGEITGPTLSDEQHTAISHYGLLLNESMSPFVVFGHLKVWNWVQLLFLVCWVLASFGPLNKLSVNCCNNGLPKPMVLLLYMGNWLLTLTLMVVVLLCGPSWKILMEHPLIPMITPNSSLRLWSGQSCSLSWSLPFWAPMHFVLIGSKPMSIHHLLIWDFILGITRLQHLLLLLLIYMHASLNWFLWGVSLISISIQLTGDFREETRGYQYQPSLSNFVDWSRL